MYSTRCPNFQESATSSSPGSSTTYCHNFCQWTIVIITGWEEHGPWIWKWHTTIVVYVLNKMCQFLRTSHKFFPWLLYNILSQLLLVDYCHSCWAAKTQALDLQMTCKSSDLCTQQDVPILKHQPQVLLPALLQHTVVTSVGGPLSQLLGEEKHRP